MRNLRVTKGGVTYEWTNRRTVGGTGLLRRGDASKNMHEGTPMTDSHPPSSLSFSRLQGPTEAYTLYNLYKL